MAIFGKERDSQKLEKEIDKILTELTLDEKITMVHAAGMFRTGGVERLGIPPLICDDGPMGVRCEFHDDRWVPLMQNDDMVTYFPSYSALASTWNRDLAKAQGHALGEEARGRGKDVILAPGINIKRDPRCGRNFEYMSEDPALVSAIAAPFIQGIQENDVSACVKHFACNGQETDRLQVNTVVDDRTLYEIYLPGFRAAVQEGGTYSLMSAYNKVNGYQCSENRQLLDFILRAEWGFDGLVISDWGGVHRTKESAEVTQDLEMSVFPDFDEYWFANPLKEAIQKGEIEESALDAKVRNVLRLMFRLHMIGKGADKRKKGAYNTREHQDVTRQVAEESMILLKNDDGALPLQAEKIHKIAVIGQNAVKLHADGGGSAEIKALYEICPLMGLKTYLGGNVDITYVPGYYVPEHPKTFNLNWQAMSLDELEGTNAGIPVREENREESLEQMTSRAAEEAAAREAEERLVHEKNQKYFARALEAAKDADVVLYIGGLNHDLDTEGADRPDMKLPYEQDALIEQLLAVRPDMIVTLIGGSPVEMPWRDKAKTILWSYYAGMETGHAYARVLFGDVNPSGKLAETFPAQYADCPTAKNGQFGLRGSVTLQEGLYVGYRYYDEVKITPAFCFGHGLSYTTFAYEDASVKSDKEGQTFTVSVTVRNMGDRDGKETVQLYIVPIGAKVERPICELKSFAKVALAAGKSKKVTMTLTKQDFAYFNAEQHAFVTDPGSYEVRIGASSRDIRQTVVCIL